jgi:hypothetical protein
MKKKVSFSDTVQIKYYNDDTIVGFPKKYNIFGNIFIYGIIIICSAIIILF